jgi:hypothetical protein
MDDKVRSRGLAIAKDGHAHRGVGSVHEPDLADAQLGLARPERTWLAPQTSSSFLHGGSAVERAR